mgnify:CR=1 FL=1|tara:strand:- start:426 stop:602 length:177 start_codon:yes stop_codon:yes gene_type:complete
MLKWTWNMKINNLEKILEVLCLMSDRQIYVLYPENEEEVIPYLIQEIKTTLNLIEADK